MSAEGYMTTGVRMVNWRNHDCGCVTAFDVVAWASRIVRPCTEHVWGRASQPPTRRGSV